MANAIWQVMRTDSTLTMIYGWLLLIRIRRYEPRRYPELHSHLKRKSPRIKSIPIHDICFRDKPHKSSHHPRPERLQRKSDHIYNPVFL